jgi:hypothetical protein
VIIVNPDSGPGAAPWWPNKDYIREIPLLNAYANVKIVGYVHATYCERLIEDVFQDIKTYAKWPKNEHLIKLEVQGIFVDETVNLYSPQAKQYLRRIDDEVKTSEGIGGNRIVG